MIPIQAYFQDEELAKKIKQKAEAESRTLSNTLIVICKEYFKKNSKTE